MKVLILALSTKHSQYCVAGINIENNQLVRIISNNLATNGAISRAQLILTSNKMAKVLDIIEVPDTQHSPSHMQVENYLVSQNVRFDYVYSINVRDLRQYYNKMIHSCLVFGQSSYAFGFPQALQIGHSLEFIYVSDLELSTSGFEKTKCKFLYNGIEYYNISVTDPLYFGSEITVENAYLLLSISADQYAIDYGCYILAASIIIEYKNPFN